MVPRKVKFALFIDLATKLRVVCPLMQYNFLEMKAENAEMLIKAFSERWLSDKPRPEVLIPDCGKTMTAKSMHDFCNSVGVQLAFPPEKESWAHGIVEAAIQDVKMTATAIQTSSPEQNPEVTLYLAAAALNSTEYTRGFSSFQWCFGKAYNITEEDIRTFEQLPQDQRHHEFEQLVQARQKAEDIARSTRAKRVLSKLVNTTVRQPLRTFQPMDLVKVWRRVWPAELHRGARQGLKKSGKPHWIGPGRVIFHEVLPHQQADDDRRHVVWVLIGTQLMMLPT